MCVGEDEEEHKDVLVPALHHGIKTVDLVTSQVEGGVNTHTHSCCSLPSVCLLSEVDASC